MKGLLIGVLIAIGIVLVILFLAGCLCVLILRGTQSPKCVMELRIKRSNLDAVIAGYGLNTEEELREYLWFNCGIALVIEEK